MSQIVPEQGACAPRADSQRVLIVERDAESMHALQGTLTRAGFVVTTLHHGEDALKAIDRDQPHLVILDWEHPGVLARNLIRHIRHEMSPTKRTRLMALSLDSSEQHIVSGFELGADDYVIKPYSLALVVARVRAVLRPIRPEPVEPEVLEFQRLRMDLNDLRVMVEDHIVALRPMEFRLLEFLMRHPERVFTREQMLSRVWARESRVDQRAVDVNIQRTRKALARYGCGDYLQTVRAFGYRLSALTP